MAKTLAPICVVDDDASIREAVGGLIRSAGWKARTFKSARDFLARRRPEASCLVLDVDLPGLSGLDLQKQLVKEDAQIPIIFLTGRGDIPMSVRAIKTGALEFLTKPFDDEQLLTAIRQAIAQWPMRQARGPHRQEQNGGIIGASAPLKAVLDQIKKVGPTDLTVLIMGETGTGKELAARAIHNRSKRRGRAFVSVNCAAIPSALIASELFGHEKGAFTGALQRRVGRFELAEGGTIFLDKVGDLPAEAQALLLRVLQEKEFERVGGNETIVADVRVIAATNRDLQLETAAGTFRSDLFYRLNVFPIGMPPLRERKEDIPALVDFFIRRHAQKTGEEIRQINDKSLEELQAYSWPGNIRELQNVIERSLIVCDTEEFSVPKPCLAGIVETKTRLSYTGSLGRASVVSAEHGKAAGVCARCGRSITHPSPDGECMRCLASFGFLSEEQEAQTGKADDVVRPGPLRYAHFEVEVNTDGYPKILGSGAMAVTYCARDTILNSTVALKVISRKLAENPTARARFLREARAAAQIQQPNVARVIHYGEQDGECFYAMELVHGETLEERVQRDGPLPLSLALEVVEQTARGLAAGEACGVIHRDLKPSNLMIESDPSGQMLVKIIDYGVAKVMLADQTIQTQAGFIGTPAFASPEQFNETGQEQVDTRSDIYSLGIVFWYLLTGRTPFRGKTLREVRAKQGGEMPIEQLKAARVPAQITGLLRSMLAVDPEKRPQNARELLTVVHRSFVRFEPGALLRRKQFFLGFAVLGAVVAVALAILGYQRSQTSSQLDRAIAVLPFQNLSSNPEDRFFAIGIQDEILTKLASLAGLKVIARTSTQGYQSKPVDLRIVGQQLNVGRVLEGSLQRSADKIRLNVQLIDTRTNTHVWANSYDRKLDDVFAVQSEIAKTIAEQLEANISPNEKGAIERSPTRDVAAFHLYTRATTLMLSLQGDIRGKYLEAIDLLNQAVAQDPSFLIAYCQLAHAHDALYFFGFDHSPERLAAAEAAVQEAFRLQPDAGEAHLARAENLYQGHLDYDGALAELAIARQSLPNHPRVFELTAYIANRQGKNEEWVSNLERAVELDPRNSALLDQLSQSLLYTRRYEQAARAADSAAAIEPDATDMKVLRGVIDFTWKADTRLLHRTLDSAGEKIPGGWLMLMCALAERDITAANRALTRSGERAWGFDAIQFSHSFGEGLIARMTKDEVKANSAFLRARAEQEKIVQSHPDYGPALSVLALIDAGLGRKDDALREGRHAMELMPAEKEPVNGAHIIELYAVIAAWVGDKDLACEQLALALKYPIALGYGQLKLLPFWDPLRGDPRFEKIVASLAPKS